MNIYEVRCSGLRDVNSDPSTWEVVYVAGRTECDAASVMQTPWGVAREERMFKVVDTAPHIKRACMVMPPWSYVTEETA